MKRLLLGFLLTAALSFAQKLQPIDETSYPAMLKTKAGKVVLVDFWATWCAPCRKELPLLVKMESALRSKGFALVTVSADEPEQEKDASDFLKQSGVPFPAFIKKAKDDDKFIAAVDPKWSGAVPALFLYDKSGKRVKAFIGETPPSVIEAEIRKLL